MWYLISKETSSIYLRSWPFDGHSGCSFRVIFLNMSELCSLNLSISSTTNLTQTPSLLIRIIRVPSQPNSTLCLEQSLRKRNSLLNPSTAQTQLWEPGSGHCLPFGFLVCIFLFLLSYALNVSQLNPFHLGNYVLVNLKLYVFKKSFHTSPG